MLARAAVSSDGSTGGGCSSKPTPMAAGRIQFLPGWWSEAISRLLAGGHLSSFHMSLSIGQLITGQLAAFSASKSEGEQDGSLSLL